MYLPDNLPEKILKQIYRKKSQCNIHQKFIEQELAFLALKCFNM